MLVLGPLAGVTAAYMNFSLGFFVGGQVLAGLLGSAVTAGYGADGKHGANYIQTAAASVASMSGMGVLVQAMVWMGLPQPPAWQLVAYFAVHRHVRRRRRHAVHAGAGGPACGWPFPPGWRWPTSCARSPTPALLRRSIAQAGRRRGGGAGASGSPPRRVGRARAPSSCPPRPSAPAWWSGARIGIPAVIGGLIGWALQPFFVSIGWLEAGRPVSQDHVPDRAGH